MAKRKRSTYIVSGVITAKYYVERAPVSAFDEHDALNATPRVLAQYFAPLAATDWTSFGACLRAEKQRGKHGKTKA